MVENVTTEPVSFELAVQIASDFADIFAVKEYDFALGDPLRAKAAARRRRRSVFDAEQRPVRDRRPGGRARSRRWRSRKPGDVDGGHVRYRRRARAARALGADHRRRSQRRPAPQGRAAASARAGSARSSPACTTR